MKPSLRRLVATAGCALALVPVTAQAREQESREPRACYPSRFGPDDQIGNLNYITPEKTLAAAKLITRGKAYRLAIETNKSTPAYPPRTFHITILQPNQIAGSTIGPTKTTYNDDLITGWAGVGTQLDGLGHLGIDNVYYNCNKAVDFVQPDGLRKLGIEQVPAIATRAVLLDMAGYYDTDMVKEGTVFNRAAIDGALKRQGVSAIGRGDVVLFHTGWASLIGRDNARFIASEPGLGLEGARYLASLGVAIVGADTWGVDAIPPEPGAGLFEAHQILIPMNGIFLLENVATGEMARDKAWESFFTVGPARITGGVQAIVNPVAIR